MSSLRHAHRGVEPSALEYIVKSSGAKTSGVSRERDCLAAPFCLTEEDARLLERAVAINGGTNTHFGLVVAEKLGQLILREAIPPDYVALDSLVVFRVGGRSPINRVLVHWDNFMIPGFHLSLHTLLGAALFGMRAGHEAVVLGADMNAETIKVESVEHRLTDEVADSNDLVAGRRDRPCAVTFGPDQRPLSRGLGAAGDWKHRTFVSRLNKAGSANA